MFPAALQPWVNPLLIVIDDDAPILGVFVSSRTRFKGKNLLYRRGQRPIVFVNGHSEAEELLNEEVLIGAIQLRCS